MDRQRYRSITPKEPPTDIDGDWFAGGVIVGACVGCIWPAAALGWLCRSWLFAPPAEIKARKQQAYIEQLEREIEAGR